MQKTFFIIKPDAVKRHLMGQVIDRIDAVVLLLNEWKC